MFKFLSLLFVSVLFADCSFQDKSINAIVQDFAALECQAMELRRSRFALADSIRFSEDTLLRFKDDSIVMNRLAKRMQMYEEKKKLLVKNSLELAKTIQLQLDSLMKDELSNKEKRKSFDKELEGELNRRGCK